MLTAYQLDIEYRSTTKYVNTDCLYHLPVHSDEVNEDVDDARLMNVLQIESLPMNVDQVREATRTDPVFSRVLQNMMAGWPDKQITLYLANVTKLQPKMVVYRDEFE